VPAILLKRSIARNMHFSSGAKLTTDVVMTDVDQHDGLLSSKLCYIPQTSDTEE
jgi:hypothetical protein